MSGGVFVPRAAFEARGLPARVRRRLGWWAEAAGQRAASAGVPPAALGHRWRRRAAAADHAEVTEIHPPARIAAPLPLDARDRAHMPGEAGWFGFSFRDVPDRANGPTRLLRLRGARVLAARRADGDYAPAILDARGRSLELREVRHRAFHAPLGARQPALVLPRALWVAERVYHNHAHWLTAHLPKLALLREMDLLADLVLPAERDARIDASLRRLGIEPDRHPQLPTGAVLAADELLVVESDRFRPELLRLARDALAPARAPGRRLYVSRRSARGRRVLGEAELLGALEGLGFEAVEMERMGFDAQVEAMAGAEAVVAPHGAGLANMLFCPEGALIAEIADPAYPNPNFYAMAAGLGLRYGRLVGRGVGDGHPLDRDLTVDPDAVRTTVEAMLPA